MKHNHEKPLIDFTKQSEADRIEELTVAVENVERCQMLIIDKLDAIILKLEKLV